MGAPVYYRVRLPAGIGPMAALATARRMVADSGQPPVESRLWWSTVRPAAVTAVADLLSGGNLQVELEVADPGPLLVALADAGVSFIWATQRTSGLPRDATVCSLSWDGGPDRARFTLYPPEQVEDRAGLAEQLARAERAGLLTAAACEMLVGAAQRGAVSPSLAMPRLRDALPRAAALWHPGAPVRVTAQLGDDVPTAVRVSAFGAGRVELDIDGDAPVDALVADLGEDCLQIEWDCDLPGAGTGYNGFALQCNTDRSGHQLPGRIELEVMISYKNPRQLEVVGEVAARSGVEIDPEPRRD